MVGDNVVLCHQSPSWIIWITSENLLSDGLNCHVRCSHHRRHRGRAAGPRGLDYKSDLIQLALHGGVSTVDNERAPESINLLDAQLTAEKKLDQQPKKRN